MDDIILDGPGTGTGSGCLDVSVPEPRNSLRVSLRLLDDDAPGRRTTDPRVSMAAFQNCPEPVDVFNSRRLMHGELLLLDDERPGLVDDEMPGLLDDEMPGLLDDERPGLVDGVMSGWMGVWTDDDDDDVPALTDDDDDDDVPALTDDDELPGLKDSSSSSSDSDEEPPAPKDSSSSDSDDDDDVHGPKVTEFLV
jgi:hypothetical protein